MGIEQRRSEHKVKCMVIQCFTFAPRIWKSDLASQRGKELEVPLAQAKRSIHAHIQKEFVGARSALQEIHRPHWKGALRANHIQLKLTLPVNHTLSEQPPYYVNNYPRKHFSRPLKSVPS